LRAETDGVTFRPIEPDDGVRLLAFHHRLSSETTRLRFFTVHPELSPREVEWFTRLDHRDREALVAVSDDEIRGVARYERVRGTDEAEVAFVVEDAWQGRGLGHLLLHHLADLARRRGVTRFVAETLSENRRAQNLFQDMGLPMTRSTAGGVVHLVIELRPASSPPPRTA
jgi:GNAT superfamily N-acetyltransferase